jgi:hypothetical protein
MGGTSGTRRQRSVMVVMKGALYVHAFEISLLGRNLVFWFYFLNLFMLKCHIFIDGQTRGFFAISGRKLSSKGKYRVITRRYGTPNHIHIRQHVDRES